MVFTEKGLRDFGIAYKTRVRRAVGELKLEQTTGHEVTRSRLKGDEMGVNYYLRQPPCPCCQQQEEGAHIGKSSLGWRFTFNGSIHNTIDKWREMIAGTDVCIYDEYGENISKQKFWELVETKQREKALHHDLRDDYSFVDYDFS